MSFINSEKSAWFEDFYLASGNNGLTGLSFWLMSLFAQQVRAKHKTIPFWEYTGVAGAGKSTVIEFLWQLVGRHDYEGEDPEKMSFVGLARTMMQASNIPVVMLEGDRDASNHRKKFSMDQVKTLFRGQSPYGRGVRNSGIETDNEPFLGTLVVSQNAAIEGEVQILSRFVQCVASKQDFSRESYQVANRLKSLDTEDCVHFLHSALRNESAVMAQYNKHFTKYRDYLLKNDSITDVRIAENHAQIMAFGRALQLIVPELDYVRLKQWIEFMAKLAVKRQIACQSDTPLVQKFWDIFETYNERVINAGGMAESIEFNLNHLSNDKQIAINLNHFKQFAEEKRQQIDMDAVRKLLPDSKRYKFVKTKKVKSQILSKVVHCWVFEGGE